MEDEQILKRQKKEKTDIAIRDKGFYGKNGKWNSIITFPGDKRIYRERVETIIVKDKKFVFLKRKPDGSYFLPGGSTEKNLPHIDQAINECREEAHINVTNIQSTGISYKEVHEVPNWAKRECDVEWNGSYTEIYVAEYESTYKGKIDKVDEDPFIRSGKFYSTKECFKFFKKEHREALLWFLKSLNQDDEDVVTESYISNYFKNKKLLKRISYNPEISRQALDQLILTLKKEYSKLSTTSKIQRERKRVDVSQIFHPIISIDFSDGSTISVAICFDDDEITDGAAIHSEKYSDMIVVYPCFFKSTKENQIFTILHEIGHIRLHHLEKWNYKTDIFGNDKSLEYRQKLMGKGKVMYPEVNADLYAVLSGASMYSILTSTIQKDTDEKYDYRFTNQELANRYRQVFNKYNKYKPYNESDFFKYDVACLAIYEMIYENDKVDNLSDKEKDNLYSILFEYCINTHIKNNENVIEKEKLYKESLTSYIKKLDEFKFIISNTIENAGNNDDNICFLENSMNTLGDIADTEINEKVELINLKNILNNNYTSLTFERAKAFEDYSKDETLVIKKHGNNPKIAQISTLKSNYILEFTEIVESMIFKLKTKENIITEKREEDKINQYLYLLESLSSSERSKIPEDKFGIPETRSYPLDTKKHVHSAVILFGKADKKYQPELAERIFKAMDEFNISKDMIGEKSQLYKYLNK